MDEIRPKRGDIWWVELDPVVGTEQSGRRPAIVVSSNYFLESGAKRVTIVPITTRYRQFPSCVPVNKSAVVKTQSWALTDQIRTLDFSRLKKPAGRADEPTLRSIERVLRLLLDL